MSSGLSTNQTQVLTKIFTNINYTVASADSKIGRVFFIGKKNKIMGLHVFILLNILKWAGKFLLLSLVTVILLLVWLNLSGKKKSIIFENSFIFWNLTEIMYCLLRCFYRLDTNGNWSMVWTSKAYDGGIQKFQKVSKIWKKNVQTWLFKTNHKKLIIIRFYDTFKKILILIVVNKGLLLPFFHVSFW